MSDVEVIDLAPVESKGVLVFYINVGMLPPFKAEAFLERARDNYVKSMKDAVSAPLPKDITMLFVPVRPPEETFVDYIPFDGVTKEALEELRNIREGLREFFNEHLPIAEDVEEECCEQMVPDERGCSGKPGCCAAYPHTWWSRIKGFFGCA